MNTTLTDEVLSINAIYTVDTLTPAEGSEDTFILRIPSCDVSLRLSFPCDYPDSGPTIQGPESSGLETKKGEANEVVAVARATLEGCFRPGEPCIYDLLEELVQNLASRSDDGPHHEPANTEHDTSISEHESANETPPPWILSKTVTEKKSVFLARAAQAESVEKAQSFIEHLITTDKKAARATHNISAWRIRDNVRDLSFQDSDDDGETAAGGRLLHLLQVMDVWNVVVVVSRWYGGVHLGPDRFRFINTVARDALARGNFANVGKAKGRN